MKQRDGQPPGPASQIGRYGGHGITLGLSTALFAWLGLQLDLYWGTKPLFVLVGTFVGFGAGFYRMYRDLVMKPSQDGRTEDEPGN
ncbi:MAG: AtpZ/AtpI family protein [Gemmatimonadota bacterium]|nr:AtpZ/AtpI family protein [Gemmatimonadota bacterium]